MGSGMDAVKAGVHLAAQLRHVRAGLFEQRTQVDAPGPIHRIHGDVQIGGADRVKIDEGADVLAVGGQRIELLDEAAVDGFVERQALGRRAALSLQLGNYGLRILFAGRAAVGRFELDAVVARRIVAGCNHHAAHDIAGSGFVDDGKGNQRRGCVAAGEPDVDIVGREDLGDGGGVAIAEEARVVADDERGAQVRARRGGAVGERFVRNGLGPRDGRSQR